MAGFMDKLSNLGNKVAEKTTNFGNMVAEKTNSSTENIKLSGSIKEEERCINENYIAIGKKYREVYGAEPAPEFAGILADITRREALINEYKLRIQQNKGKTNCKNCGAEIDAVAAFCTNCGTKNPMAEEIARRKAEAAAQAQAQAAAQAQARAEAMAAQAAAQSARAAAQAEAAQTAANAQSYATAAAEKNAENTAENITAPVFCKNCGTAIVPGNAFCTNCGTRVE